MDDVDDSGTSVSVDSDAEVREIAQPMAAEDDNLKDQVEEIPKEIVLEDENNNIISEDLKEDGKEINYGNIAKKKKITNNYNFL